MKYFLLCLAMIGVLVQPSYASIPPQSRYWFCMQLGFVDNQSTLILSSINDNITLRDYYAEREQSFNKFVRQGLKKRFSSKEHSMCFDFNDFQTAQKARSQTISEAKKYQLQIMKLMFSGPDIGKTAQQ